MRGAAAAAAAAEERAPVSRQRGRAGGRQAARARAPALSSLATRRPRCQPGPCLPAAPSLPRPPSHHGEGGTWRGRLRPGKLSVGRRLAGGPRCCPASCGQVAAQQVLGRELGASPCPICPMAGTPFPVPRGGPEVTAVRSQFV